MLARVGEILDFTGRQTAERIPQRHQIGDGLWLREGRRGHTGHDSATMVIAGVPGFSFGSGEAYGLHVAWSGRVDLAMLERVQRVWTSDMTDALARQSIQRWTGQLVPPKYLGAHVSAPFSHQTGRYMPLSLRCATALFGHLGIEWDITQASDEELAELAAWIRLYKEHRALIHSGRMVRIDTPDDSAWMYGVVAPDQTAAVMSYAQLDEPVNDQPAALRISGLDPLRRYQVTDVTCGARLPRRTGVTDARIADIEVSGAALAEIGLGIPPQRALTALVILIEATRAEQP